MDEMTNDERSRDSEMTEPDTADVSWPDSAGEGSRTEMFVTIEPNPRIFAAVVNHRAESGRSLFLCSLCRVGVHPADRFCRSCGASFVNGGSYGT